jgi:UDP-GlcNAc3NAcA epimerase
MRVCLILGTRPQFIKAAALHAALVARGHATTIVDTGQHVLPSMADDFIAELGLPDPHHRLGIGGLARSEQLRRMTAGIDSILDREGADWVVVFGDTNSTLAGARAAHGRRSPLAHVEAGLRSFNPEMPEEQNRVETDRVSTLLFCPSERARRQLAVEGRTDGVHVVGDVMRDALEDGLARGSRMAPAFAALHLAPREYLVATVHRVATTDDAERLRRVFGALEQLPLPVVCPVHPRTAVRLAELVATPGGAVRAVPPLGHTAMVSLMASARAVLTDSGGVQKEAYWLGVPCLTLRDETEWSETVEAGWNHLVGTDHARILAALANLSTPSVRPALYGEPGASGRIVDLLEAGCAARSASGAG